MGKDEAGTEGVWVLASIAGELRDGRLLSESACCAEDSPGGKASEDVQAVRQLHMREPYAGPGQGVIRVIGEAHPSTTYIPNSILQDAFPPSHACRQHGHAAPDRDAVDGVSLLCLGQPRARRRG